MQNRRTDDPAEKDRSASYSIKQPKTYTWKQENIRTGKLPRKPEQPRAKKTEPEQPKAREARPEKLRHALGVSHLTLDELSEILFRVEPGGIKEIL